MRKELPEELGDEGRVHWGPSVLGRLLRRLAVEFACPKVELVAKHINGQSFNPPPYPFLIRRPMHPSPHGLNMPDASRYYILGAFFLGVAVTTTWNYLKPSKEADHELRISHDQVRQYKRRLSHFATIRDVDALRRSIVELSELPDDGVGEIKEGIEGCIGNTPLIKIKSLSEATGCEILAKAEVELP